MKVWMKMVLSVDLALSEKYDGVTTVLSSAALMKITITSVPH